MTTTGRGLSYFRLKLETYLGEYSPKRVNDNAFVTVRADETLTAYRDAVAREFSFPEAETVASEMLYHDLHFPKYGTLTSVLEQKSEKEPLGPLPERLAPILLNNKAIQAVSVKCEFTDNSAASTEYDRLCTELTGTVMLLIEVNGLPTIGGESMT